MKNDALLTLGQIDFSVTPMVAPVLGQVAFPDIIDFGSVQSDIGKGEGLMVEFTVDEEITADYSVFQAIGCMTNDLVTLANAIQGGTADVLVRSGDIAAAGATATIHTGNFRWLEATAGLRFYMPIPPMPRGQGYDAAKRYFGCVLNSTLASVTVNTGKITARIVLGGQLDHAYPTSISVT